MIPYEIPLSPEPQSFTIQLAGTEYFMAVAWNRTSGCWILDISDTDRNPMLMGVPLVTGLDLLEQYDYLGFSGYLLVQTDFDADAVPTFNNLGITGRLYFLVEG